MELSRDRQEAVAWDFSQTSASGLPPQPTIFGQQVAERSRR
jgi:hypothetical protein